MMMTILNMVNGTMTLTGYLCDHPTRVQDYRVLPFNQSACWAPKAEPTQENIYSIVQKQTYARANGTKCSKQISRFTFVCTHNLVAAHQRLARIPEIEVPVKVKQGECHTWVTTGHYPGPDGKQHRVDIGRTTILTFYEHGRQEVSGQSIICEGEQVKLGDRLIDGVAVLEQVKVTLERRNFRFAAASATAATVQVQEDHVELPCVGLLHYCETSEATYIWEEIQNTQYQLVQSVTGELREEEGQQVLISRDKKIRLVLGEAEKEAGRTYRATKYNNIYVCDGVASYLDSINSNHLRLVAWVAARDDYLSWALEQRILETYSIVSNQRCHREQDMLKNQMATSFTSPEGFHHLHLGENRFGALIGEVLYEYVHMYRGQCGTKKDKKVYSRIAGCLGEQELLSGTHLETDEDIWQRGSLQSPVGGKVSDNRRALADSKPGTEVHYSSAPVCGLFTRNELVSPRHGFWRTVHTDTIGGFPEATELPTSKESGGRSSCP